VPADRGEGVDIDLVKGTRLPHNKRVLVMCKKSIITVVGQVWDLWKWA
jgi:hypothetical protein